MAITAESYLLRVWVNQEQGFVFGPLGQVLAFQRLRLADSHRDPGANRISGAEVYLLVSKMLG